MFVGDFIMPNLGAPFDSGGQVMFVKKCRHEPRLSSRGQFSYCLETRWDHKK